MNQSSSKLPKFRPYITAAQVTKVLRALKSLPQCLDADIVEFVQQLEALEFKIQRGIVRPAISVARPLHQQLEDASTDELQGALSPAELHAIWLAAPENLSVRDIERVQEWRYENNKMTAAEEREHERKMFSAASGQQQK